MIINNKYSLTQKVFLVTDGEQQERMITSIQVTGDGGIMYQLSCGTSTSWHYDGEISEDKNILKSLD